MPVQLHTGADPNRLTSDTANVLDRIGTFTPEQLHRARLTVAVRCELPNGHADVELGQMYLEQLGLLP